jgi:hypothetical protein
MKIRVPYKAGNLLTSWATTSVSSRALIHSVSYYLFVEQPAFRDEVRHIFVTQKQTVSRTNRLMYMPTRNNDMLKKLSLVHGEQLVAEPVSHSELYRMVIMMERLT